MRNAINPHAQKLLDMGLEDVLAVKERPVLAYTSTPFRGLDILLNVFDDIRDAVSSCELHIYSSMKVYGDIATDQSSQFQALYEKARGTEGVFYKGSVPQSELAKAMLPMSVFAYPNYYLETSCIAALEAMAAGLTVVSTSAGALPETTAGHAALIDPRMPPEEYKRHFIARTVDFIEQQGSQEQSEKVKHQRQYIREGFLWGDRAVEWQDWLSS